MAYKTILVPYDGSNPSKNALKEAVELAKQSKGKVSLLYVVQEIVLPPWSGRATTHKTVKEYEKELYYEAKERAEKLLEEAKKKYEGNKISIEIETSYGNAAEKITSHIKSNKIDIVVIGTTSRTGISKLVTLGSVARKVAEKSPCPVLLVH